MSQLEKKMALVLEEKAQAPLEETPWYMVWNGAFKDNADFDSAMKRGEEYRKSQPNPVDAPDAVEF